VTPAEKLRAALALLDALKSYQDTGRDAELLKAAWERAWAEATLAAKEYVDS
jgi:hypothetical protein